jgi:hypothetical protein
MKDPQTYTLPAYVVPPIVRETRVTDNTMPRMDWRKYDRPTIARKNPVKFLTIQARAAQ